MPRRGRPEPEPEENDTGLFFLLAVLGSIVVPWTLVMLWGMLFHGRREVQEAFPDTTEDGQRVRQCQTKDMASKRNGQVAKLKSRYSRLTRGFIFRLVILILLWAWLIYIILQIRHVMATSKLYQNFEPYQILELSRGAKAADIKKAYRKLSLKYHPDRNQGDPAAADKFMLMKKAYDALTDPIARKNFEMYGNPDGPVRMEVGMAIPSISKENQGVVLVLFVFFFILGIPMTFLCCMNMGESVLPNGIIQSTMQEIQDEISRKRGVLKIDSIREILLKSGEARQVCSRALQPGEAEVLERLKQELDPPKPSKKKKDDEQQPDVPAIPPKAELLFLAHVRRRLDLLDDQASTLLKEDLVRMLRSWRLITLALADLAGKHSLADTVEAAIEMHRCIVQAIDPLQVNSRTTNLLQVPHLNSDRIKHFQKMKKPIGLPELLDLPADRLQTTLEPCGLDAQEIADVQEFIAIAPRVAVKDKQVYVRDEDEICWGYLATFKVMLERAHLREGEAAGSAHTPFFPDATVREAWWIFFTPPGKRTYSARVTEINREVAGKVIFKVPEQKKCRCKFQIMCEAYEGFDLEDTLMFEASKPEEPQDDASGEDEDLDLSEPGE